MFIPNLVNSCEMGYIGRSFIAQGGVYLPFTLERMFLQWHFPMVLYKDSLWPLNIKSFSSSNIVELLKLCYSQNIRLNLNSTNSHSFLFICNDRFWCYFVLEEQSEHPPTLLNWTSKQPDFTMNILETQISFKFRAWNRKIGRLMIIFSRLISMRWSLSG